MKNDALFDSFKEFELGKDETRSIYGGEPGDTTGCQTGDTFSGTPSAADDCDCDWGDLCPPPTPPPVR